MTIHFRSARNAWFFVGALVAFVVESTGAAAFPAPTRASAIRSAAFQDDKETALKKEKLEKDAKKLLDRIKRLLDDKTYGTAYTLLLELRDKYPYTAADDEGQKMIADVKAKADKAAVALVEKAEKAIGRKDYMAAEKLLKEAVLKYPGTKVFPKIETTLKDTQKSIAEEKDAVAALNLIRKLASDPNKEDLFRKQAEAIIKKYPTTKAADEARMLLKNLP
jgi:outer membrane protein assembly factor BamD (BamD/ComL family)